MQKLLWAALIGIGITISQACSSDSATDTADTKDASGNGADSFVVEANGTTRTLTLPNGQELEFEFPASAAGQTITLRLVDDASYGLEGEHPNLVEMLPHGLTFSPPVLVTPDWSGKVPVLRTFADGAGAENPEILPIASDKRAFELAHFSLLSVNSIDYNCPFAGTDVSGGVSKLCKTTQKEVVFYCDNTTTCLAINAHCCMDQVGNPNLACSELLDYTSIPINYPPCGPGDAGPDVIDGSTLDGAAGGGGSGGSGGGTGTGGSGGTGGGTVGGCPNTGYYSVGATGACGDLDPNAPEQRLDGTNCQLYWEFEGSNGIGSNSLSYSGTGVTTDLPINLGSGAYLCTATSAHPNVTLDCVGASGTCNVSLLWTGPL